MDIVETLDKIEAELDKPIPIRIAKLVVIGIAAIIAEKLAKKAFEHVVEGRDNNPTE